MNKFVCVLIASSLTLVSCAEKEHTFKQSEIDAKIDSLVALRIAELNRRAMDDLEDRIAIEVKAKADSILAARAAAMPVANPAPAITDTVQ